MQQKAADSSAVNGFETTNQYHSARAKRTMRDGHNLMTASHGPAVLDALQQQQQH
jgi:hypothetical protein